MKVYVNSLQKFLEMAEKQWISLKRNIENTPQSLHLLHNKLLFHNGPRRHQVSFKNSLVVQ